MFRKRIASRWTIWLSLMTVISGCSFDLNPIPANAVPEESDAVATLKPLVESIAWDENGRVHSIDFAGNVTDEVIQALNRLDHLEMLGLFGSVTDDQFVQLQANQVRSLSLAWSKVTDDGLKHLVTFEDLALLDLEGTEISDAAVPHLVKCRGLQRLFIAGTRITDDGERELRRALPNAIVQSSRT